MTPTSSAPPPGPSRTGPVTPLGVLRVATMAFGLLSLAAWGYLAWPFPWPAVLAMVAAPLFAVAVWLLFRSPRSVVRTDRVGKTLVETAVVGAVVVVWVQLGYPVVAVVVAVVALVTGVLVTRREGGS